MADGRNRAAIDGYFEAVGEEGCALITMVAMDMSPAYIGSVQEHTDALIAFDKFHQHDSGTGGHVGIPRSPRLSGTSCLTMVGFRTERSGRSATLFLSILYRAIPAAVYSFMHNLRLD